MNIKLLTIFICLSILFFQYQAFETDKESHDKISLDLNLHDKSNLPKSPEAHDSKSNISAKSNITYGEKNRTTPKNKEHDVTSKIVKKELKNIHLATKLTNRKLTTEQSIVISTPSEISTNVETESTNITNEETTSKMSSTRRPMSKRRRRRRKGKSRTSKSVTNVHTSTIATTNILATEKSATKNIITSKSAIEKSTTKNVITSKSAIEKSTTHTFITNISSTTDKSKINLLTTMKSVSTTKSASTVKPVEITELKSKILNDINKLREKYHSPPLKTNETLSLETQKYADDYIQGDPKFVGYKGPFVEMSYIFHQGKQFNPLKLWAKDKNKLDFKNPEKYTGGPEFTQLIWQSTTHIGCGISSSNSLFYIFCRFSPKGNIKGQYAKNIHKP
uniref:SCP domain-containing protein n=1 Tax=Strongyloides papillosus TaxID=174720 RepID=A0A0N5BSW9_STREA